MPIAEVKSLSPPARMIVELNLRHYRDLLKTEREPSKRRTIASLLAEEETKLVKLMQRPGESDEHH
jgi:hypothetical protein